MAKRKRYAQVGLGGRSGMYTDAILDLFPDVAELVGLCDTNAGRLRLVGKTFGEKVKGVPLYSARQFDRMIKETKPDTVIVTTVDQFHDRYICRAMELGCDVVTEKPMTTDAKKCQRIVDTVKKTRRKVRVTFNYRYSPPRAQVKDLLMKGTIGRILSVEFKWLLNVHHGADYYRRWHRNKVNSGGLLVHKATHHFDLVNWWIASRPAEVFAMGHREFYVPSEATALGLKGRAERCHECPVRRKCKFFISLSKHKGLREMYLANEKYDGYFRDRCVFSGKIDIEDSMNLVVRYQNGALMSYALNSFLPWEGYRIAFNGTRGRLEQDMVESVYISGDGSVPGETIPSGTQIRVYPQFKPAYTLPLWTGKGGHGGGDPLLLTEIFSPNPPKDPLKRGADHVQGAWSILTGVAANLSMKKGKPVAVDDLVQGLAEPGFVGRRNPR